MLLPLPDFEPLAAAFAGVEVAGLTIERFENGELEVRLAASVTGRDCLLLGTAAPPAERLVELLLVADTVARNGAGSLQAVLPYLAYARQDVAEPGRSLAAAWLGRLLGACGVEAVTTIDIHSERALELFCLSIVSLSPAQLFAAELAGAVTGDTVVVAPDEGALARAEDVALALDVRRPVVWLEKERGPDGVIHKRLVGDLERDAIIVDDILDTGATLISACRELRARGVEQITVAVTHGLFTGWRWHQLSELGVGAIHTTDSVPTAQAKRSDLVHVHSVAPLLAAALSRAAAGAAPSRP
jgi:ribose-phosphate pyrophosphokinase